MKKQNIVIPIDRFRDAFSRLGWIKTDSKSKIYEVWSHPKNKDIWTVIPEKQEGSEYKYYQNKNIKMLLFALDLPETDQNIDDITNQLLGYNYKLLNRIVNREEYKNDSVPFELAEALPSRNIDAFRSFYLTKTKGKSLPINIFELNHTQFGSFIIPISIIIPTENDLFNDVPSETNTILRDYLKTIDKLTKIEPTDAITYANKIIDEGIDSKIVKEFLSKNEGIAKYKDKYKEKIKDLSISGASSPLIDFNLAPEYKAFQEVNLTEVSILSDEYIETLEKREIEVDSASISEYGVSIEVTVDAIDQNGTAKFSVYSINKTPLEKPFKAISVELSRGNLNKCVDVFKERNMLIITGDITKTKGRPGKIVPDSTFQDKPKNPTLFDDLKEDK